MSGKEFNLPYVALENTLSIFVALKDRYNVHSSGELDNLLEFEYID